MTLPVCQPASVPCVFWSGQPHWQPPSIHHDLVGDDVIRQSAVPTVTRSDTITTTKPEARHARHARHQGSHNTAPAATADGGLWCLRMHT